MTVLQVIQLSERPDEFDGNLNYDSITLRYRVTTDGTEELSVDVVNEAIAAGSLPAPGELLRQGLPYKARKLKLRLATPLNDASNQNIWIAEVTFDNQTTDANDQNGFQTASRFDPEDPKLDVPEWAIGGQTQVKAKPFDYRGARARNTAGDLFDPLPEMVEGLKTYQLTFNAATFNDYSDYEGSINSGDVSLNGNLVKAGAGIITQVLVRGPFYRFYKPPASPGSTTITEYWTYEFSFETMNIPRPANIAILDPTQIITIPLSNNMQGYDLLRDGNGDPISYLRYGDYKANVGFNVKSYGGQPLPWDDQQDYDPGEKVRTDAGGERRFRCIEAVTSAQAIEPGVTDGWEEFWQEYAFSQTGWSKRRILRGDVEDLVSLEDAKTPIDTPVWLDAYGRISPNQDIDQGIYVVYFQTSKERDWSNLPGVTT